MNQEPSWIYDFNRQLYFFIDRHHQRVYQDDPRLASRRVDDPRTVPQQPRTEFPQANSYISTPQPGAYVATSQPPQSGRHQVRYNVDPRQNAFQGQAGTETSLANNSALIGGFHALNLGNGGSYDHQKHHTQKQQSGSPRLLCNEFKKREKPIQFFTVGKVFIVLWTEGSQADRDSIMSGQAWSKNSYEEWVYTKVRRFIVVNAGVRSCVAVPITTNNGQGVAKDGERKSDYCIVHSGAIVPPLGQGEGPAFAGDAAMMPQAIRVDMDQAEKLDPMSRIKLAEPRTIQHYYKVKSVGKVHPNSMGGLMSQFKFVMGGGATTTSSTSRGGGRSQSAQPSEVAKYKALIDKGYTSQQAKEILQTLRNPTQAGNVKGLQSKNNGDDYDYDDDDNDDNDDQEGEKDSDRSRYGAAGPSRPK